MSINSTVVQLSADDFRRAGWLPTSREAFLEYTNQLFGSSSNRAERDRFIPAVQEFREYIENDPVVLTDFKRMFDGAEEHPKNLDDMLLMLNEIFREAPKFGSLGPPVYMILARSMNTQGGFSAYTKENLNLRFKRMFEAWSLYLNSKDSCNVINHHEGGWLSTAARAAMMREYDGATFEQVFLCDTNAPYYGFTSYEDFFNRRFRHPQISRPTGSIQDSRIISAACESRVYAYQTKVKKNDQLFIKDEAYSLVHLLANDPYTEEFVGGSVLQGFLDITGYHRWHSPVNGHIKKIVNVPGTYFAQAPSTLGSQSNDPPPYLRSLRFFANTATRQLIFIESDYPRLGLICFVAIGMTEISTCQATVYEGQHVMRGEELGMFRFGGSSFAVVFRADANVNVDHAATVPGNPLRINQRIASADPI